MRYGVLIFLLGTWTWQASAKDIHHTVTKDETPWFLATVYYGKGNDNVKILKANHLKNPDEMSEGMDVLIPDPKYDRSQSGFAARYSDLWKKRAVALKKRNKDVSADKYLVVEPLPASKVVIPTEQIRRKDSLPTLPFTEIHEDSSSIRSADLPDAH